MRQFAKSAKSNPIGDLTKRTQLFNRLGLTQSSDELTSASNQISKIYATGLAIRRRPNRLLASKGVLAQAILTFEIGTLEPEFLGTKRTDEQDLRLTAADLPAFHEGHPMATLFVAFIQSNKVETPSQHLFEVFFGL